MEEDEMQVIARAREILIAHEYNETAEQLESVLDAEGYIDPETPEQDGEAVDLD